MVFSCLGQALLCLRHVTGKVTLTDMDDSPVRSFLETGQIVEEGDAHGETPDLQVLDVELLQVQHLVHLNTGLSYKLCTSYIVCKM